MLISTENCLVFENSKAESLCSFVNFSKLCSVNDNIFGKYIT